MRVRSDGRIEVYKRWQTVRDGVPCKGMEGYWELLSGKTASADETARKMNGSAKEDTSTAAATKPMNGHEVHWRLGLARHRVRGDGSCWHYEWLSASSSAGGGGHAASGVAASSGAGSAS